MGTALLTFPFFKIQIGEPLKNGFVGYEKESGADYILENMIGYFINTNPNAAPDKSLVIISFTVSTIVLMQFVAGLVKRDKLIISTAVIMLGILLVGLFYIISTNSSMTILYGYYVYIVIQLVLAFFTPIKPVETKGWANKS